MISTRTRTTVSWLTRAAVLLPSPQSGHEDWEPWFAGWCVVGLRGVDFFRTIGASCPTPRTR
jgi:hypothetical protein